MSRDYKSQSVLVTGGHGFLGTHVVATLKEAGFERLSVPSRAAYDLREQDAVRALYEDSEPELVVHLAGLVGGILANRDRPAEFFNDNLIMGTMMAHEAWRHNVSKYVTCIGGCSYPAAAVSPIEETTLWEGYPQPESAPYSLAKSMSVLQSKSYRQQYGLNAVVLVPGNMYGPHDNFNAHNSHVVAAMIRRFFEAKRDGIPEVEVWGSGRPTRDFVYVGDVARAVLHGVEHYNGEDIINISSGRPTSIRELAELVAEMIGYSGGILWDTSKPDGQSEKIFAVERMRTVLGFEHLTDLREGLRHTVAWFQEHYGTGSVRL